MQQSPGCKSLWLKAQASFSAPSKDSLARNPEVLAVWVHGVASDHHGDGKYSTKKNCVNPAWPFKLESQEVSQP